jgi:hypothetical protein
MTDKLQKYIIENNLTTYFKKYIIPLKIKSLRKGTARTSLLLKNAMKANSYPYTDRINKLKEEYRNDNTR